jgi:putative FmdB family regulatory protein
MPIYEYRCLKCGKTFEALQSVSAEPIRKCIHCQGKAKKIVSRSSFQLKGKGWYLTDYKKRGEGDKTPDAPKKTANKKNKDANLN